MKMNMDHHPFATLKLKSYNLVDVKTPPKHIQTLLAQDEDGK